MKILIALLLLSIIPSAFCAVDRVKAVKGIAKTGETDFIAAEMPDGSVKWLRSGIQYRGNKVLNVSIADNRVTFVDAENKEYSLKLDDSVVKFGSTPQDKPQVGSKPVMLPRVPPSEFSKAKSRPTITYDIYPPKGTAVDVSKLDFDWINSDQNPMKSRPIMPNDKEFKQWPDWAKDRKDEFVDLYMQCGWAVEVATDNKGVSINFSRVSAKKESAELNNNNNNVKKMP